MVLRTQHSTVRLLSKEKPGLHSEEQAAFPMQNTHAGNPSVVQVKCQTGYSFVRACHEDGGKDAVAFLCQPPLQLSQLRQPASANVVMTFTGPLSDVPRMDIGRDIVW